MKKFLTITPNEKKKSFVESHDYDDILKNVTATSDKFKIVSYNVNGIRAILNKQKFLQTYIHRESPDIVFLEELKIQPDIAGTFEDLFEGYTAHLNCCKTKKGYSGVGVYTKTPPIKITDGMGKKEVDQEGRLITVELESFYVLGSYVPNSGAELERLSWRTSVWDKELRNYIATLEKLKPVILTGDLNVAHQDMDVYDSIKTYNKTAGNCKEEKENFTTLLSDGYFDAYRALYPTTTKFSFLGYRSSDTHGWRLDYFVVSKKLMDIIDDSLIRNEITGSDHRPVVLTLLKDDKKREDPIVVPPLPTTTIPKGYKNKETKNKTLGKGEELLDEIFNGKLSETDKEGIKKSVTPKKRGRPKKTKEEVSDDGIAPVTSGEEKEVVNDTVEQWDEVLKEVINTKTIDEETPKKRGRPRKIVEDVDLDNPVLHEIRKEMDKGPKKRGRKRKEVVQEWNEILKEVIHTETPESGKDIPHNTVTPNEFDSGERKKETPTISPDNDPMIVPVNQ